MTETTRPLVGTIHPDDMAEIREGVDAAQRAVDLLHHEGARIEVPTPWRWWEYGTAIQMMLNQYKERMNEIEVLDVGSGWSALGPTLQLTYNTKVTEYEPNAQYLNDREGVQHALGKHSRQGLTLHQCGLENMPETQFDVVCCVSVLEHVAPQIELASWVELARRVKPNGMLYITTDCVPYKSRSYTFDNLREQNFVLDDLMIRTATLEQFGFTPMGKPDWTYHGSYVYDYTFWRCGMMNLS